jgi:ataxin-10
MWAYADLLSLLDIFLPRIQFGKPVNSDGTPLSSDRSPPADVSGFSYVKRDLVRLLGVLSHGVQSVQDRTREAGGLPVVMNMCVVDERNPCAYSLLGFVLAMPDSWSRSSGACYIHIA